MKLWQQVPRSICGVYRIRHRHLDESYIGASQNMRKRFIQGYSGGKIDRAIQQYGQDAFVVDILLICEPRHLWLYETLAVEALRPTYNEHAPSKCFYWPESRGDSCPTCNRPYSTT